jgi:acetylornithine deacetylase/succinyl-diaminopimelate desuccinylase family protein
MINLMTSINSWVKENQSECIDFLQKLISIPSPSHNEKEIAEFLSAKMKEFGYSSTFVDEKYDALGIIKGQGKGRNMLFNGHIDHVPVGNMMDPYSGKIMDGKEFGVDGQVIYGRAASDMKGGVAAMVLTGKLLNDIGVKLKGDFKVAAVAQEEVGGAGTISTIIDRQFLAEVVLIGEATNMNLALGHRGSSKTTVVVKGKSCHASAPERGINALYKATKLINLMIKELEPQLPDDDIYGKTSLAVTQIEVKPKALNVVPEECIFHIDCRNNPKYSTEQLYNDIKELINKIKENDHQFKAVVLPSALINGRRFSGFYTDPEKYPVVNQAIKAISEIYKKPEQSVWTFATDGRMYSRLGFPVLGFGPGEEKFAHTQQDHIKIRDFLDTIKVYSWLLCRISGVS